MNQIDPEQQIELFRGQGDPLTEYQQAQLARQVMDYRREVAATNFTRLVLLIGLAFVGGIGLLIASAIMAAAVRPVPPPAPVVNPGCILFCGGR